MEIATKKFTRFLLAFGLIVSISVVFFSAYHSLGMEKRSNGTMSGCVFTGKTKNCTMTIAGHTSKWQGMFTTTAPQKLLDFALLILLAVSFIAVAILKRNLLLQFSLYTTRWRLYIRQHPSLFNLLQEAFSQGILNPKIY